MTMNQTPGPAVRIEHVNVTVSDPEKTAAMLEALFGWHVRWQGPARDGGLSIHVGDKDTYIALYREPGPIKPPIAHKKSAPLNHIALVVDDLDAVEQRVLAQGIETFNHGDYEPGRRFYFFDRDRVEYEIVSYRG